MSDTRETLREAVVQAAIEVYQSTGGTPAVTAVKKLDAAVEAYLAWENKA